MEARAGFQAVHSVDDGYGYEPSAYPAQSGGHVLTTRSPHNPQQRNINRAATVTPKCVWKYATKDRAGRWQ